MECRRLAINLTIGITCWCMTSLVSDLLSSLPSSSKLLVPASTQWGREETPSHCCPQTAIVVSPSPVLASRKRLDSDRGGSVSAISLWVCCSGGLETRNMASNQHETIHIKTILVIEGRNSHSFPTGYNFTKNASGKYYDILLGLLCTLVWTRRVLIT